MLSRNDLGGRAAVMGCGQIDKALQGKSVFIKLFYNDLYNLNDSFGRPRWQGVRTKCQLKVGILCKLFLWCYHF